MSALDEVLSTLDEDDPFSQDPADMRAMQLSALGERFEQQRQRIKVLDKRATEQQIEVISSLDDVVNLLFAHSTYKSYPESLVDKGRWDLLLRWIGSLSSAPVDSVDVAGVRDIDEFINRLRDAGHMIICTSGTSGKASFLNLTMQDQETFARAINNHFGWPGTVVAQDHDLPLMYLAPGDGPSRFAMSLRMRAAAYARSDALFYFSEVPFRLSDVNAMGRLRRRIADGTATPEELAASQATGEERQALTRRSLERIAAKIIEHRDEPCVLIGGAVAYYRVVEVARRLGYEVGDLHPGTVVSISGGAKAEQLPPDFMDQVRSWYKGARFMPSYGMSEMSSNFPMCEAGFYHCPPWIVLLLVTDDGSTLLNADEGSVEGRMAFFDFAVEGRWGGLISGDKIVVNFGACACGRPGPVVHDNIMRYSTIGSGDDKLTCAGTIEGYIRGFLAE